MHALARSSLAIAIAGMRTIGELTTQITYFGISTVSLRKHVSLVSSATWKIHWWALWLMPMAAWQLWRRGEPRRYRRGRACPPAGLVTAADLVAVNASLAAMPAALRAQFEAVFSRIYQMGRR